MQFSLTLIAAAAFLLPNLVSARALLSSADVAKRDILDNREVEALSYLELTKRDFESSIEAAQVKRDAYAEALAYVDAVTGQQLVARGTEEDIAAWEKLHTQYKGYRATYDQLSREAKAEKDNTKKAPIQTKMITALQGEITLRKQAQPLVEKLAGKTKDFTAKGAIGHKAQIKNLETCLVNLKNKKQC
ncbi:hypothetical protein B0O99DRAFT_597051 [Bisporella sp. PMI_857]|nr:hypothetical protein B0O99DRAFT_597051 [Bisporella sp. PMI_857]